MGFGTDTVKVNYGPEVNDKTGAEKTAALQQARVQLGLLDKNEVEAQKLRAPDTADALMASRARTSLLKNRNQDAGRAGAFGLAQPVPSLRSQVEDVFSGKA